LKLDRNAIVGLNHREISNLRSKPAEIEKHWDRLKQNKSLKIEEEISIHKSKKIKFQTSYTPILDIQKTPFKVLCILSVL
jgi:hypothetical protein